VTGRGSARSVSFFFFYKNNMESIKRIVYVGTDKWSQQLSEISKSKEIEIVHSFIPEISESLLKVCKNNKIPYSQTKNINNNLKQIQKLSFDLFVVIGHPYLLKEKLLNINSGIGFHPSLLPKRRGRAPLNWAIIDGLKESGVSLFKLEKGVDNGDIFFQERFSIEVNDNVMDLVSKVNNILNKNLSNLISVWPNLEFKKQDEKKATYTSRRYPEDGEITSNISVSKAGRLVRALSGPYPSAFIRLKDGKKLYLEKVSEVDSES